MHRSLRVLLLIASGSTLLHHGGCAGGSRQVRGGACGSCVSLQVRTLEGSGFRAIAPEQALTSGADFALTIKNDEPLYLYVARQTPAGDVVPLLPDKGQQATLSQPGMPTLLPAAGWMQLDDRTGPEKVIVLGSRRALSPAEAQAALGRTPASLTASPQRGAASAGGQARGEGECVCAPQGGSRGVDETNSRNREFDPVRGVLWGRVDADGQLLLVFPFAHK